MKTTTQLRDELYEMDVLAGCLARYSKKELETLIAGVKDETSRIGEEVRRDVTDYLQNQTGIVVGVDGNRAQVQWDDKRTWYRLDKLIPVKQ